MPTIRDQLKTTFLGLAGLLSKMNVMQNTSQQILTAVENIDIDTSDLAKEATLGDVASVLEYMEQGGMPEIENIAKQGTNPDATNTAILEAIEETGSAGIPVVQMTATTATIEPNKLYIWDEVTSLDLTLAAPADPNIVNEYMCMFGAGSVLPTLTLPAAVEVRGGMDYNKIMCLSIINNIAYLA